MCGNMIMSAPIILGVGNLQALFLSTSPGCPVWPNITQTAANGPNICSYACMQSFRLKQSSKTHAILLQKCMKVALRRHLQSQPLRTFNNLKTAIKIIPNLYCIYIYSNLKQLVHLLRLIVTLSVLFRFPCRSKTGTLNSQYSPHPFHLKCHSFL